MMINLIQESIYKTRLFGGKPDIVVMNEKCYEQIKKEIQNIGAFLDAYGLKVVIDENCQDGIFHVKENL